LVDNQKYFWCGVTLLIFKAFIVGNMNVTLQSAIGNTIVIIYK